MKKVIIAAIDLNFAIGNHGGLPWQGHQRADMKRFVELTMGFPMIMGRKTYESFPRRPLRGRTNIVITHQSSYLETGCVITNSLHDAITVAERENPEKVCIIGGAEIYRQTIELVDELDLTMIRHRFEADTFFPFLDARDWCKIDARHFPSDSENLRPYSFLRFKRRAA